MDPNDIMKVKSLTFYYFYRDDDIGQPMTESHKDDGVVKSPIWDVIVFSRTVDIRSCMP